MAVAWAVIGSALHAQPVELTEPLPERRPPDVYINDSFEANELLSRMRKRAKVQSWGDVVEIVGELLDHHSDKLVADSGQRFVSLPQAVENLVNDLPPAGRAALARRFDSEIEALLAEVARNHDLDGALSLWSRYSWSSHRLDIARQASELAIEAGAFSEAAHVLETVQAQVEGRADGGGPPRDLVMRQAIVYAIMGRRHEALALVDSMKDHEASQTLPWSGGSAAPSAIIDEVLQSFSPVVTSSEDFSWPVFGGDVSRTARMDRSVDEFAMLWQFQGLTPELHSQGPNDDPSAGYERALEGGQFLFYHPVVAHGLVYIQDYARIWAIDATTGRVVWKYEHLIGESRDGSMPEVSGARWFSVTVSGNRLYACFGGEPAVYYGEAANHDSVLVCLDALTGARQWSRTPPGQGQKIASMRFDGAPLVWGDKLFTVVRRQQSFGFEDCYLCRLNTDTGEVEFQTHVGSGSAGGYGFRLATMSIPAISRGDVFVATNLGTIASVSTHTGMVNWLRIYDRSSPGDSRNQDAFKFKPWQRNPVLCDNRRVVISPVDAGELYVLDQGSGIPLQVVDIAELKDVDTIIGIQGANLYGLGSELFAYNLSEGAMLWAVSVPSTDPVRGRPTLVGERILVPGKQTLRSYDLVDGSVTTQAWDIEAGGGNLLAMPGQLIVAGHDRIAAYARKEDVWARLKERLAGDRDSVGAALDLADLALRSGDRLKGAAFYEEAIRRAEESGSQLSEIMARRLFESGMSYAERAAGSDDVETGEVIGYLTEAERWAPTTADYVSLKLRMADEWRRQKSYSDAVTVYQGILSDRSLRLQDWSDGAGAVEKAGDVAARRIDELITNHGREIYAPYDKEAERFLKASMDSDNLSLMDRVLEEYPGSEVWDSALHERGRMLVRLGRPLEGARDLYQVYVKREDRAAASELVGEIAASYITDGRTRAGLQWLDKGALMFPEARLSRGAETLTFGEWRDELAEYFAGIRPERASISLPFPSRFTRTFDEPIMLLDAPKDMTDAVGLGLAVVYSDGGILAIDPTTGADLWGDSSPCDLPPRLLSAGRDRLLFHTRFSLFALEPATGRRLWSTGETPKAWGAPEEDWEGLNAIHEAAVGDRYSVLIREKGQLECVLLESGETIWSQLVTGSSRVVVGDQLAVVFTGANGGQSFVVLRLDTGKEQAHITHSDDQQVLDLSLSVDGTIVVTTSTGLFAYSSHTGLLLWSSAAYQGLSHERVLLDTDGVYVCHRNEGIEKLSLNSGAVLWHVDVKPFWRSRQLVLHQAGHRLILEADSRLFGIDAVDGRLLWQQRRGEEMPVGPLLLTRDFGISIEPSRDGASGLKGYAHRILDGLGEVPDGGVIELDGIEQFDRAAIRNGAMLLSQERVLEGFISGSD